MRQLARLARRSPGELADDAGARQSELARLARCSPSELFLPAKKLKTHVPRIFLHHPFVAQGFELFEQRQSRHPPDRQPGPALLAVKSPEPRLKTPPLNHPGQPLQRLPSAQHFLKAVHQKPSLFFGFLPHSWFHPVLQDFPLFFMLSGIPGKLKIIGSSLFIMGRKEGML
jgi:hypothetical protein